MAKLKPEDLPRIRESQAKALSLRETDVRAKITVHLGTCGIAAGAKKIVSAMTEALDQREDKDIVLTSSGCAGLCSREPMMTVEMKGEAPVKYVDLNEDKARKILEDHVLSGAVVKKYALAIGSEQVA